MAARGPGTEAGGERSRPSVNQAFSQPSTAHQNSRPDIQESLVYMQCCGQDVPTLTERSGHVIQRPGHALLPQGRAERAWMNQTTTPTTHSGTGSGTAEAPYSCFRSLESVEMDEIMAAMVLTSLSCSPVVQTVPQTDPSTVRSSSSVDMECGGGGELSDSGSSGYWSWDHGSVSPAPSPSVTEMDSSPEEGLHMELEQGEELHTRKSKNSFKGVYKCLWPGCGKVLISAVGITRHIRVLHLRSASDQSQREEDFYYTKISCEAVDHPASSFSPAPLNGPPSQGAVAPAPSQASFPELHWSSCGSVPPPPPPPGPGLQIPAGPRPRSNSMSGTGRPSPLSQSAPSSFWQIHTEHLYQACTPPEATVASRSPAPQCWTPPVSVPGHHSTQMAKPRCRSVSVGEQWLQQNSAPNRLQTVTASPSRAHCTFRKGRGEAKKCRKVYGVERKDQWCTACRWKKACQRFPD